MDSKHAARFPTLERVCRLPGFFLWWAVAIFVNYVGELVAYLPPRTLSSSVVIFFGIGVVCTYTDPWQKEKALEWAKKEYTVYNLFCTGINTVMVLWVLALLLGSSTLRRRLSTMWLAGLVVCLLNTASFPIHGLETYDGLRAWVVIDVLVFLNLIEYRWGLTLPSILGRSARPAESLVGLGQLLKTCVLVIIPIQVIFYDFWVSWGVVCMFVTVTITCPMTYKDLMFRPWFWSGPSWQAFVLPLVAALPWDTLDERLDVLCRRCMTEGVQALLPDVPLQEGYDSNSTGRLMLLMSWIGGKGFSLTAVKHLTTCRADPNAQDDDGSTVLRVAVQRNEVEIVRFLVQQHPVRERINQVDDCQRSALFYAQSADAIYLLLAAGADPKLLDCEGRSPFMFIADEQLRNALRGISWESVEQSLPLIMAETQLYDLLWDESLPALEGKTRRETIVQQCILPLLEKIAKQSLTIAEKDSLHHALVATTCPIFRGAEVLEHSRGDAYNDMLRYAMSCFKAELHNAKACLEADSVGSRVFQMSAEKERLHTDSPALQHWSATTPLTQLVAEDLPEWMKSRSLSGAFKELVRHRIIRSASEFADLLRGEHPLFKGKSHSAYFRDRHADMFWLALYALYDIGKTAEINDDFQLGLQMAIDGLRSPESDKSPEKVRFMGAEVKSFARVMEKLQGDLVLMESTVGFEGMSYEKKCQCAAGVKDKARNSFICASGLELWNLVERFSALNGTEVQVRPGVRLRFTTVERKSGFLQPSIGGYSDIKYWTLVERVFYDTGAGQPRVDIALVAESQLILDQYLLVKDRMHIVYEAVRGDFDPRIEPPATSSITKVAWPPVLPGQTSDKYYPTTQGVP